HDGPFLGLHQLQHRLRVDARDRDEAAQPVDQQRTDHEQQALPKLGELAGPRQPAEGARAARHPYSPTWPPAASIAAFAPAVASRPWSTNFLVTSPFFTTLACLAVDGTSLAARRAAKSMVPASSLSSWYSRTSAVSFFFSEA